MSLALLTEPMRLTSLQRKIAVKRVMPPSAKCSKTISAKDKPDWGLTSGELEIFTAKGLRFIFSKLSTGSPVRGQRLTIGVGVKVEVGFDKTTGVEGFTGFGVGVGVGLGVLVGVGVGAAPQGAHEVKSKAKMRKLANFFIIFPPCPFPAVFEKHLEPSLSPSPTPGER